MTTDNATTIITSGSAKYAIRNPLTPKDVQLPVSAHLSNALLAAHQRAQGNPDRDGGVHAVLVGGRWDVAPATGHRCGGRPGMSVTCATLSARPL